MSPENLDLFLPPQQYLSFTLPNGAAVFMDDNMNGTECSTSLGSIDSESTNQE
jgi:hypothetical protein